MSLEFLALGDFDEQEPEPEAEPEPEPEAEPKQAAGYCTMQ